MNAKGITATVLLTATAFAGIGVAVANSTPQPTAASQTAQNTPGRPATPEDAIKPSQGHTAVSYGMPVTSPTQPVEVAPVPAASTPVEQPVTVAAPAPQAPKPAPIVTPAPVAISASTPKPVEAPAPVVTTQPTETPKTTPPTANGCANGAWAGISETAKTLWLAKHPGTTVPDWSIWCKGPVNDSKHESIYYYSYGLWFVYTVKS